MIDTAVIEKLVEILDDGRVQQDVSMGEWTSFKTGGNAECLVQPSSIEEVSDIVSLLKENNVPLYVLGNGSNTLVRDGGLDGVVMCLYQHFNKVDIDTDNCTITMHAGALLSAIANYACRSSLSGLEFAGGIPGSMGGAVKMNAGAYDGEICDVLVSATVLHDDMTISTYTNDEMDFSYRHSRVTGNDLVLEAVVQLSHDDQGKIRNRMVSFAKKRKEKQPLNLPSAGSAFKRPSGNYASALIDKAGLSGYTIGGAQVSTKHCGFIVNTGKATAADIENLLTYVKEKVYETSGVTLEREIIVIGKA